MQPALNDPLVQAARSEFERIWRELGSPSPLEQHADLEAARRVYHAVLRAAECRWLAARTSKPQIVA
jgi:hypothetical protein